MWLVEILVSILLEGIILSLFRYPGSVVIWILSGFTIPFKELLNGNIYITGSAGIISVLLLVIVILK